MRTIFASSFSNAFLGGIAVWACAVNGHILVWAAIVAWGCFFHTGGNNEAVRITIIGTLLGIVSAWLAGLWILANPLQLPAPIWAGLAVGIVTLVMVFVGHMLAIRLKLTTLVIPASFYGAASTFAYMVQTPDRLSYATLLGGSMSNPIFVLPISMVIGALLGFATAKMTSALAGQR